MFDVDGAISAMTLEEKTALTAGADLWTTVGIDRLGIPSVVVTDGPNGARGRSFGSTGPTSVCAPCGTALGATWDVALVEQVGALLGREALAKSARVLLAPTVNIHRSPLAGRNFECYSEDPLVSGRVGAAFVRGAQSEGVACTVKHFVGNEAEFERNTISSVIDERTLREVYLVPFEIAVRQGGALGVMTSYNRLNGRYNSERRDLLRDVLRDEWGFDGFVLTDWAALTETVASAHAGLDLEMPGPGRAYGEALAAAAMAGEVAESMVDEQVHRLLSVFDRIGVFADPLDGTERAVDRAEDRALTREAAAAGMVLLRNCDLLPLLGSVGRIALIGPNARSLTLMGGGSAALRTHPVESLDEALRKVVDAEIEVEPGWAPDSVPRPVFAGQLIDREGGTGLTIELFADRNLTGPVVATLHALDANMVFLGAPADAVSGDEWSYRASATFVPDTSGEHIVSIAQTSATRVFFDGVLVVDGWTTPPIGEAGTHGVVIARSEGRIDVAAGVPIEVVIEHTKAGLPGMLDVAGVGAVPPYPPDLLERACAAARRADVAVVVVGTTSSLESEGFDRPTMHLPAGQDDLVRAVVAENPRTVVVVNAGSPVAMDWADEVPALVYAWFGGQEMAGALADVLVGRAEPGGRLPTTIPVDVRHNPSFGNFPGENGEVRYGEGVFVGYRWYESRHLPVRFPFGHGLSYTSFTIGEPVVHDDRSSGGPIRVEVPVANVGRRAGSEVVQCYVVPIDPRLTRPLKELKAFAKTTLEPGTSATVTFELDDRAFSYWDPGHPELEALAERLGARSAELLGSGWRSFSGWRLDPGRYELHIGRSSADIAHVTAIEIGPS